MKIGQVRVNKFGVAAMAFAALAILGTSAYFIVNSFSEDSFVSEAFIDARKEASFMAFQINYLTEKSLEVLSRISEADRKYNFSRALELVHEEQDDIKEIREKSISLTKELDNMTREVSIIRPEKARNLAISAISEEISLINHLVNYNAFFGGLLETLKFKFSGDIRYDSSDVQDLVNNMNKEVAEVNRLNKTFGEKLAEFDKLTEKP
ncbi:MAG: hypothetical protein PHN74_01880 [Candidatus Pacebacteria bacterium]|nr:hypothetical protein [Candidatus Paceibacterota bacterium]